MFTNGLGTLIYSYLVGRKIGEDNRGNKYFLSKKDAVKKWVLYENKVDPTNLPVEWQLWLTNDKKIIPSDKKTSYFWQKERAPNLTGTKNSYHPAKKPKEKNTSKEVHFKKENNKIWSPN